MEKRMHCEDLDGYGSKEQNNFIYDAIENYSNSSKQLVFLEGYDVFLAGKPLINLLNMLVGTCDLVYNLAWRDTCLRLENKGLDRVEYLGKSFYTRDGLDDSLDDSAVTLMKAYKISYIQELKSSLGHLIQASDNTNKSTSFKMNLTMDNIEEHSFDPHCEASLQTASYLSDKKLEDLKKLRGQVMLFQVRQVLEKAKSPDVNTYIEIMQMMFKI
jgi:hypothetical protein